MAKQAVKKEEPVQAPATIVPVKNQLVLSDEMANEVEADAGKGVSTSQADNIVPLIYILQGLSPQVQKRGAAYIEGAEPGMFWLRNAPTPVISGEDGLVVQPCYFQHDYVEWRPRESGGGFVRRHEGVFDSAGNLEPKPDLTITKRPDPNNENKIKLILPNGNELIDTRSHIIRVKLPTGDVLPYILPFSSTGHTTSRQWMTTMNNQMVFRGDGTQIKKPSSFTFWYRLTTRERTNAAGTWFAVDVQSEGMATIDEMRAGRTLHDAFASGIKEAEAPIEKEPATRKDMDDEIPF